MKYLTFAFFLICSPLFAYAEGKIAVLDFEKALFNTDLVQTKVKELQASASYKKNVADIQAIQNEGKALVEKLKKEEPTMSNAQKEQANVELKSKQEDIEHIARKVKEAEAAVLQPLMMQLNAKATDVVKGIVTAKGIGLLLNSSAQVQAVLHADTSFDITAEVTDKLNKMNAKK